jgi:hypothetical protein
MDGRLGVSLRGKGCVPATAQLFETREPILCFLMFVLVSCDEATVLAFWLLEQMRNLSDAFLRGRELLFSVRSCLDVTLDSGHPWTETV